MTILESTKTISIYSNNLIMDIYIQKLKFLYPYQIYYSVDKYINSTADFKISFVNHLNGYDLPISEEQRVQQVINGNKFCQDILQLKQVSNMVFAFENEMHDYHFDIFKQNSKDNVYWVIPIKTTTNIGINSQNLIFYPFQFGRAVNPYRELRHKLQEIHHNCVKPKYFDALLGLERTHRNFVYDAIEKNHLQQKILTTYTKNTAKWLDQDNDSNFKKEFLHEPDIENFHDTITHSAIQVGYQGRTMALSVIVPIQIYNQTAYSIITETHADNRYSFFTEKIFKPMLAHRLFVVFSGFKYLENLRSLGFQTFDNVIDESYDQIVNDEQRWAAAFEQVKRLCDMSQAEVLEKISQRVQHNYNLVMDAKWQSAHLLQIQQKIHDKARNLYT
jgi:hypothetical protein